MRRLVIHADRLNYGRRVALWFAHEKNADGDMLAARMVFDHELNLDNFGQTVQPTTELSMTEAQQLIDQLWNCGLRPTEGAGSAGSLAATERHLADMRRIALNALDLDADVKPGAAPGARIHWDFDPARGDS